ncbi:sensor histidine kinase [Olivibacter sitiensis]|uniref:sensor histidine kinase n=1 Tax=Olivibacter sitiensis TaxID=376470 RepID=UPI0003FC28A5|nr:histidine kinase [Olivibacter sitiensis]
MIHVVLWLFYWLYELAHAFVLVPETIYWTETILMISLNIVQFYIVKNWALPEWGKALNAWRIGFRLALITGAYAGIKFILYKQLQHLDLLDDRLGNMPSFLLSTIHRSLYFSLLAAAFWFYGVSMRSADAVRKKELEKEKLKGDLTAMRLAVLRAQINPHFLFNTLSFIYSKAFVLSEQLAKGILTLSEIMRYSIQESDLSSSAKLMNEVRHIENLILLNRYRFNDNYHISFKYVGVKATHRIVPFILITMVENAMKYGDGKDADFPITIWLSVEKGNNLRFCVKNRKLKREKLDEKDGIGMRFVKSRLKEFYEHFHHIQIHDSEDFYELQLDMELIEVADLKKLNNN